MEIMNGDVYINMNIGRPGKMIMCVNDGTVYSSFSEAAKSYNTTRSAISKHVNGKLKSVKGLRFVEIMGDETQEELLEIRIKIASKQFSCLK